MPKEKPSDIDTGECRRSNQVRHALGLVLVASLLGIQGDSAGCHSSDVQQNEPEK